MSIDTEMSAWASASGEAIAATASVRVAKNDFTVVPFMSQRDNKYVDFVLSKQTIQFADSLRNLVLIGFTSSLNTLFLSFTHDVCCCNLSI